jgi:hypothetical protein
VEQERSCSILRLRDPEVNILYIVVVFTECVHPLVWSGAPPVFVIVRRGYQSSFLHGCNHIT